MRVHLIAALAANRVIGADGKMPWHLPDDLKRFKRLTLGHPIIMGRKTWDSLGRPLPGRENIVVTRNPDLRLPGATVVHSLAAALDRARTQGATDAWVIGGGEIFREALPLADTMELTLLEREVPGDATFPSFPAEEWRETAREPREHEGLRYRYVTLERVIRS